jgi:hypothetical protein
MSTRRDATTQAVQGRPEPQSHPLRYPANPPRPQPLALAVSLLLFLAWLAFFVVVAWRG